MNQFRELATFAAVAEHGGFNAAARALNISPPSVTRLINELERRLGTRLFNRTTRQVALTEAGEQFYADAVRILTDLAEAEEAAAGVHQSPRGQLRLTAPVMFGQLILAPIIRAFLDAYPTVTATTLFVDRVVDLIEEGLDVALRIGELPDSSLMAVRIGTVRRVLVAAPDYLAARGTPATLGELTGHRVIHHTGLDPSPDWLFVREGRSQHLRVAPALTANTGKTALDAALAGWGITRLISYQAAEHLTAGELIEVLPAADDRALPIHLVHAGGRTTAAKVRVFIDFAAPRIKALPGLH